MEKIKKLKTPIITTIVCLLPIVYGLIIWDKLPAEVPTHWNLEGEVDGYSSKAFAVFGLPLIMAGANLICQIGMRIDPKHENYGEKVKTIVVWMIPVMNLILSPMTLLAAQGIDVDVALIVPLMCGILFLIIGNYLPKCKQNYTMGIKVAWTLNSEENWNKTHRFAGFIWTMGSMIIILTTLLGYPFVLFPVVLIMAFVPIVYSYLLYRKGV